MSVATQVESRQTADDRGEEIARAIVIGQVYTSGNVYVGGFVDDATREWPKRVTVTALRTPIGLPLTADFSRQLAPDSEEQYYFAQREDGGSAGPDDLFSTIDGMVVSDPNLALYRGALRPAKPQAIFGWDQRLSITDISFRENGQRRPTTEAERLEVAANRKSTDRKSVV